MPVGDILKQNKYLLLISFACLIFLSNNNLIIAEVSKWDYNPVNYSLVPTVNNSLYWNGYEWSDTRWLNIDGSNANTNIDINGYNLTMGGINITDGTNYFSTEIWDLTGSAVGTFIQLVGKGTVYDILPIKNGVIVNFKQTFPYGIILANDEDDDTVVDNEIAFNWDIPNRILKVQDLLGGGGYDFSVDGS